MRVRYHNLSGYDPASTLILLHTSSTNNLTEALTSWETYVAALMVDLSQKKEEDAAVRQSFPPRNLTVRVASASEYSLCVCLPRVVPKKEELHSFAAAPRLLYTQTFR